MTSENRCAICGRPTPDGEVCQAEADRADAKLADIIDLAPDARLVAAGLVRRGGGSGSNKPGSRSPLNDGATDAINEIEDVLVRLALHIARDRGRTFTVTCIKSCVKPSPSNAHCGACHETFGSVSGFDRHRRAGQCLDPQTLNLRLDRNRMWRFEGGERRAAAHSGRPSLPESAQNTSGVPEVTPRSSEAAETLSGCLP